MKPVAKMVWLFAIIILAAGLFFVILDDDDTKSEILPQPGITSR